MDDDADTNDGRDAGATNDALIGSNPTNASNVTANNSKNLIVRNAFIRSSCT